MKKILSLLLVMGIIFSMAACGQKTDPPVLASEPEEMEFAEFQWPDTDIAKLMPVPKSTIGNINWSQDYGFVIYVAETSLEDSEPTPDPTPTPPDTVQSQLPPPNAPATPDVPDVTIPDAGVPLTDAPESEEPVEELMEIPEEEVPLANPDVPKTGDISGIWYTMTFLAAAGLVFITILARKNQEEAQEN